MTTTKLVLLRHGQSLWNLENRFTGWYDVGLTETGIAEAARAGDLMREAGYDFDEVHTSLLKRAIKTANLALESMDRQWIDVHRHWRLNERHYGALQGLDKKETSELHGAEQVFAWRRGYATPPPSLELHDERHPSHDAKYAALTPDVLPAAECLADVVERFVPYWHDNVVPALRQGRRVLLVAHGNSLRALVKHLDGISDDKITGLNIPTGIPLVYELDSDLKPIKNYYLGDPDEAAKAAHAVANQAK